jgi:hypothetical protein
MAIQKSATGSRAYGKMADKDSGDPDGDLEAEANFPEPGRSVREEVDIDRSEYVA